VPRKTTRDLLHALAVVNRRLGRLGVDPICSVADAQTMPDHDVREMVRLSEDHFRTVSKATKGYLG